MRKWMGMMVLLRHGATLNRLFFRLQYCPVDNVKVNYWETHTRRLEYETGGGYWDDCDFPLREVDGEMFADCHKTHAKGAMP